MARRRQQEVTSGGYQAVRVRVADLLLDPENPRLVGMNLTSSDQTEILRILWREMAVDEVALSIAANGYFPHEHLFAEKQNGRFIVIEGNRRLAAVKLLLNKDLRRKTGATDLPDIDEARAREISSLSVVECTRRDLWQYTGFKHVNGPQTWESYSKAQYIATVHNKFDVPLDEIAYTIGDQHATVQRLYRALMVLDQAETAGVFRRDDRYKRHFSFSHLYTGLDYPGIQMFIGVAGRRGEKPKPVPRGKLANLAHLLVWLYGSKSKDTAPVVRSQNPDLRILDEVLRSENGVAALQRGLPLKVSLDVSRGDERLFREALVSAKQSLQQARGTLLTGYNGETDLYEVAGDIRTIAERTRGEMEEMRAKHQADRSEKRPKR